MPHLRCLKGSSEYTFQHFKQVVFMGDYGGSFFGAFVSLAWLHAVENKRRRRKIVLRQRDHYQ